MPVIYTAEKMKALVGKVEAFLHAVDELIIQFQDRYQITCPSKCGTCCEYPHIRVSVLEFIPLAWYLWHHDAAECIYRTCTLAGTQCALYRTDPDTAGQGRCMQYMRRSLLCRVFGFMTRREGVHWVFKTCRIISEKSSPAIARLPENVLPQILPHSLRQQLRQLEPDLADEVLPINQALQRALEIVFDALNNPLGRPGRPPRNRPGFPRAA